MEGRASWLVVVGASAGGVEALKTFVAGLPPELPAAVGVVLHVSPNGRSRLPEILSRAGRLPTAHALGAIAPAVVEALEQLSEEKRMRENADEEMSLETRYSTLDRETIERARPRGEPSALSCPACGGVLWEVDDGGPLRYRCRAGHAYTREAVYEDQTDAVEYALWAAFRALHERAELTHRIAHRTRSSGATSKRFENPSREALDQANLIRTVLLERNDDEN